MKRAHVLAITAIVVFAGLVVGTWGVMAQDYGGWYVDNSASTAAEGYARGISDVVRAQGQYNLATSQAAINMTEAQSREIDVREKFTNAYFDMRATNRAARAAERGPRDTMDDFVRYAQAGRPAPLSPSQFDPVSGRIYWPRALRTDVFAGDRAALDELFAQRATYGDLSIAQVDQLRRHSNSMLQQLKGQVATLDPSAYINGKKFVESLAYVGESPANVGSLAATQ
jgi:hypothetical protein